MNLLRFFANFWGAHTLMSFDVDRLTRWRNRTLRRAHLVGGNTSARLRLFYPSSFDFHFADITVYRRVFSCCRFCWNELLAKYFIIADLCPKRLWICCPVLQSHFILQSLYKRCGVAEYSAARQPELTAWVYSKVSSHGNMFSQALCSVMFTKIPRFRVKGFR